jgi:hypothetical protein
MPSPPCDGAKPKGDAPRHPVPKWASVKMPETRGGGGRRGGGGGGRSNRLAVHSYPWRMQGRRLASEPLTEREPPPHAGRHVKPPGGLGTNVCVYAKGPQPPAGAAAAAAGEERSCRALRLLECRGRAPLLYGRPHLHQRHAPRGHGAGVCAPTRILASIDVATTALARGSGKRCLKALLRRRCTRCCS